MNFERVPQSSKLRAKVDVYFRTIADPDGALIELPDIPVSSVDITRNRPGEADLANVNFTGDAFPFDVRIIADKSMFASVWLYEQDHPALVWGGGNHFFGVVDDLDRDRYTLEGSLSCRDMTAVTLRATMPEGLVRKFEIAPGATVESIVAALLREIPGADKWTVTSLASGAKSEPVPLVLAKPLKPAKGKGKKVTKKGTLAALLGPEEVTVWGAIVNLCARSGIVPEVRMSSAGTPTVALVDGSDLQTGGALRTFQRGGRTTRLFLDGDGIYSLKEKLALSESDDRPDAVECTSVTAAGKAVTARWPEAGATKPEKAKAKEERVSLQFVPNATQDDLARLARAGFEALCHNQFRVHLTATEPWSAGGGPHDPDLLDLAYGAAVEIQTRGFEAFAAGTSVVQLLEARGLTRDGARAIAEAQGRLGAMSLVFQVAEVQHQWRPGSYKCDAVLRQFLGTSELPAFRDERPTRRTEAA